MHRYLLKRLIVGKTLVVRQYKQPVQPQTSVSDSYVAQPEIYKDIIHTWFSRRIRSQHREHPEIQRYFNLNSIFSKCESNSLQTRSRTAKKMVFSEDVNNMHWFECNRPNIRIFF